MLMMFVHFLFLCVLSLPVWFTFDHGNLGFRGSLLLSTLNSWLIVNVTWVVMG